jgi:hypothetical protein
MKITHKGASMKQMAYARRVFGGQGKCKKQIALDCGYSPNVANSISSHIENKPGFNSAMAALAVDSNNLALAAMHEFKARGFEDFSNKDLVGALNAIGSAWSRFNAPPPNPKGDGQSNNRLRTVILQQIENQTVLESNKVVEVPPTDNNDF